MKTLRVLSFFSGAGLLDHSLIENGFEIVWANDIMEGAVKTYKENIGDHIVLGDIRNIDKTQLPDAEILVAGFPCVAYSNVNRTNTRNEKHRDAFLYRQIVETAKRKDLKIIAIENVSEFVTAKNGMFYKEFKEELESLNYTLSKQIVVDKEYGGFSDRKRVIITASKIGKISFPKPTHKENFKTVKEAFDKNIEPDSPNREDYSKSRETTVNRMKHVRPGHNWKDIPKELRKSGSFHNYFRRLSKDDQSPTLVNWRKSLILHPEENRILSVREAAAIMGVPSTFQFFGTLAEKQQQVANGVTRAIGDMIANLLKDSWIKKCLY